MVTSSLLPPDWKVPQAIRDRLGRSAGRQRRMVAEGHLLLVLHAPPGKEEVARTGRLFWRAADGAWASRDLGSGIAALERHLNEYADLITALDRAEEAATTADDYFRVLEQLAPLHRAVRHQHAVLQEARRSCPDFRDIIDVRDRAYALERSAELLYGETKNALDFLVARRAEEQARSSERMATAAHRLNVLAAIFFPIVTLTGVLGVDLSTVAAIFRLDMASLSAKGVVPTLFLGLICAGLAIGALVARSVISPPRVGSTSRANPQRRREPERARLPDRDDRHVRG